MKQCNACGRYKDSYVVGKIHIQTTTGITPFVVCYCADCVAKMSRNLINLKPVIVPELETAEVAWETPNWDSD